MHVEPQSEHRWLHKLVGEWTYVGDCSMGPDEPAMKNTGTESVRSLGGLWTIGDGKGEMPGVGTGYTVMTLGYDPAKKRFLGTFIGSMMTHLWIYDGSLDDSGKVLTLDAEGPSFTADGGIVEGKLVKYQDTIEFKSDDHRTLSSRMLTDAGEWVGIMNADYHRTK